MYYRHRLFLRTIYEVQNGDVPRADSGHEVMSLSDANIPVWLSADVGLFVRRL